MDDQKELKMIKDPKNKVKIKLNRQTALISVLILGVILSAIYLNQKRNISGEILSTNSRKTIYPTQYSDKNITQNAIRSDSRFSNIAFVQNDTMIANVISSVKQSPQITGGSEVGTWLWTPVLDQSEKYKTSIISWASKNGIKNIYMSIDSYLDIYIMPDGPEKEAKRKSFDKNVEEFIKLANSKGISVDAEAGWRNWAEDGNIYKAYATINYANKFNRTHDAKFRTFQYDVEPYLLENYEENKEVVLKNFLNLIDSSVTFLNTSDMKISVVIPEFYDGTNGDTPVFKYKGKNGYAIDHLLSILDRRAGSSVIIMSYRNFSSGKDGSIDISTDEIKSANNHNTKIIIAQETGDVEPPYITFHKTNKKYFNKQKTNIETTFSKDKSFGGIAIHYVNAFMNLK